VALGDILGGTRVGLIRHWLHQWFPNCGTRTTSGTRRPECFLIVGEVDKIFLFTQNYVTQGWSNAVARSRRATKKLDCANGICNDIALP